MLLACDIGNTNIVLGLFDGDRLNAVRRLPTDPGCSAAALARGVSRALPKSSRGRIRACVIGSVVPRLTPVFARAARMVCPSRPVVVDHRSKLGVRLRVDTPSQVGPDRILNSLAAIRLFGGPAVVVDFGTATTFDCVSARGEYLGGAIIPGPQVSAKALALKAARLPEVAVARAARAIGKNTVDCIRAGLYFGYIGMVERVLKETFREMRAGGRKKPRLVATGGLAGLFASSLPRGTKVEPHLTLHGLRFAYGILCAMCG